MAYRIAMNELGIANDNTVIEGSTPGDVWRQVAKHLKDQHKIRIPELDEIGGESNIFTGPPINSAPVSAQQAPVAAAASARWFGDDDDAQARLIVTRLIEKLHVGQQSSGSSDIVPPGGTQSPMP